MIKMTAIGHLGKDALVNLVNGKNVINFTVAHSEKFTSNGEKKEKTTWIDCSYWVDSTAVAPYLKKGTQVYVEGSPDIRTYAKTDGTQGASLTLRVFSVQLLGSNEKQDTAPQQTAGAVYQAKPVKDDLPF